jgi:hypothetical protein
MAVRPHNMKSLNENRGPANIVEDNYYYDSAFESDSPPSSSESTQLLFTHASHTQAHGTSSSFHVSFTLFDYVTWYLPTCCCDPLFHLKTLFLDTSLFFFQPTDGLLSIFKCNLHVSFTLYKYCIDIVVVYVRYGKVGFGHITGPSPQLRNSMSLNDFLFRRIVYLLMESCNLHVTFTLFNYELLRFHEYDIRGCVWTP